MEPEENWEQEIVAGQPGYIPRVHPTFRSAMGMNRRERKQMYSELLKQHRLKMMIHDLQAAQNADCSDQGPSTSYHLSDTSEDSSTNGDASEAVLPQSSQDNCAKQEAPCAVGYNTAVALTMRTPCITQISPDCLLFVEEDGTKWYTFSGGRGRRMVHLREAQASLASSSRAASLRRHPRTGV